MVASDAFIASLWSYVQLQNVLVQVLQTFYIERLLLTCIYPLYMHLFNIDSVF